MKQLKTGNDNNYHSHTGLCFVKIEKMCYMGEIPV